VGREGENILNTSEKVGCSPKGPLALSRMDEMYVLLNCSSSTGTGNRSVELNRVLFGIGRDSRFDLSGQFRAFFGGLQFFSCGYSMEHSFFYSKAYFNSNRPVTGRYSCGSS
jgi:hypothetical protein